jgi:hypothetical protein
VLESRRLAAVSGATFQPLVGRSPDSVADVELDQLFSPLLGNWTGIEEQAASPWAPASQARAMMVFKLDVQGRVVVQDYRQVRADGAEFSGHGVFLLEPGTDEVRWWFFDSYGEPPEPATGRWLAGQLVIDKTTPRGTARHEFQVVDGQLRYVIELQLSDADTSTTFLTGRYVRVSGH